MNPKQCKYRSTNTKDLQKRCRSNIIFCSKSLSSNHLFFPEASYPLLHLKVNYRILASFPVCTPTKSKQMENSIPLFAVCSPPTCSLCSSSAFKEKWASEICLLIGLFEGHNHMQARQMRSNFRVWNRSSRESNANGLLL